MFEIFLGRDTIGFVSDFEPKLIQHRGQNTYPPKHWSVDQIEQQEPRDLVIIGRATCTWQSCARWRSLFSTHAAVGGYDTQQCKPGSAEDEFMMRSLRRKMINTMRHKYAYGTNMLLVSAVAKAAHDFGWRSPREDEVMAAILRGVAKLKSKSKKKKPQCWVNTPEP